MRRESLLVERLGSKGFDRYPNWLLDRDWLISLDLGKISGLKVRSRLNRLSIALRLLSFSAIKAILRSQKLAARTLVIRLGAELFSLITGWKVSYEASANNFVYSFFSCSESLFCRNISSRFRKLF